MRYFCCRHVILGLHVLSCIVLLQFLHLSLCIMLALFDKLARQQFHKNFRTLLAWYRAVQLASHHKYEPLGLVGLATWEQLKLKLRLTVKEGHGARVAAYTVTF